MMSIDVEDWFQVENLKSQIARETWESQELRVKANTRRLLTILDAHNVQATFFILGWIAERCPDLVREISDAGHEIASHGYGHDLLYHLTPETFKKDVTRCKSLLEDITGKPVLGYRAPSFSITPWALEVLKRINFLYDSSLFQLNFHDRYGSIPLADTGPLVVKVEENFYEVRISTLNFGSLRVPWGGGGYFRLYPYALFRRGVKRILREKGGFLFYMHPWEIDHDQPRVPSLSRLHSFRHYYGLSNTEGKFVRLLKDFEFVSIQTFLRTS